MFSIGEFARLGTVSVRTLRHYDEIGLLQPAKVDPETGYRSYSASQLGQLNRIIALKDLGFSLTQAGKLLSGISVEELRGMLALRRAQLEQERDEYTTRLRDELDIPALVTVTGPFVVFFADRDGDEATIYLALPVAELPPPAQYMVLPAIEAATAVRSGRASSIYPAVYHDLVNWANAHGFQTSGPGRDVWIHETSGWPSSARRPSSPAAHAKWSSPTRPDKPTLPPSNSPHPPSPPAPVEDP